MAIKVVLDLEVSKESTNEYLQFLKENLPNVRNFEGCESVNVYFNEETYNMAINEIWESKESHHNYIKFISENGVMSKLASYLSIEPNIKYYDILDI